MKHLPKLLLIAGLLSLTGSMAGVIGQEKKVDPKATKKEEEPPAKVKAVLPKNWTKLGLSDDQKQQIYKILNKHNTEIDKLKAMIEDHQLAKDRETKAILTTEQKKHLDDILLGKDKEKDKKDK